MTDCATCALVKGRDSGTAPVWDNIYRTPYWDVAHAYPTSLRGWLVIVCRRHIAAIDELTEEEALELGSLIRRTSAALKARTGCLKTYVMQFAEAPTHQHVHFHIVPRMADQPPERKSVGIFGYLGVPEAETVSDSVMNELALQIRLYLTTS